MEVLAPVVLFVYNRVEHVSRVVEALKKNVLSERTELIIYSDAPKANTDRIGVEKVREYIERIEGFSKTTVICREENYGLTKNIVSGVSDVLDKFKRVIVLEDDIETGKYFLQYMNMALEKYEDYKFVYEISAFIEPIDSEGLADSFFVRRADCWGWATWQSKWNVYERNPKKLIKSFSRKEIRDFNLDGTSYEWEQVIYNLTGRINSWAVFWNASIYKKKGVTLLPKHSLVNNIGCDGSGTNYNTVETTAIFNDINFEVKYFPDVSDEDTEARKRIVKYLKKNRPDIFRRVWRNYILVGIELFKWYIKYSD